MGHLVLHVPTPVHHTLDAMAQTYGRSIEELAVDLLGWIHAGAFLYPSFVSRFWEDDVAELLFGVPGVISGKFSVRKIATTSPPVARRDYIPKNKMLCCM